MKSIDMTNIQEAGEFTRPAPGAYICGIVKAEDVASKEYLKITYDIIEGEFKGYYKEMRANNPEWEWAGAYVKSYKEKALPMFKRFCTAVSRSNGKFVFDGGNTNHDEKTLKGKKIGLLLGEEEYTGNDGRIKTRLYVVREFSIDKLADQKVPELKKLKEESSTKNATGKEDWMDVEDNGEEVPFD